MNPNTIRRIDYWIGQPICFLFTLFGKLLGLARTTTGKKKVKRIVFLKFIEQGATVLAYRTIRRATELVGKENVYFCVFENNRPILDILNVIPAQNIITISDQSFFSFLSGAFSALLKIRKAKIDTCIDMEFFSRASAIFSFMTGSGIRIGLHRFTSELPYRGNLMTHRIQYNPYLHISDFYYSLLEAAFQNPAEAPMMKIPLSPLQKRRKEDEAVFTPTDQEKNEIWEKLRRGNEKRKIVLLNPNASDLLPLRKWDKNNFIELTKKIIGSHPNTNIIITGAPSEQKHAEAICSKIGSPNAVSFAGKTTLRQLLTLYSLADILVTNDSGPGHFSSLTNIRTIILFGPETPHLFGPLSQNAHVIWKGLACSPCVNIFNHRFSPCNNNVCMQTISVDEVYEAVINYFN